MAWSETPGFLVMRPIQNTFTQTYTYRQKQEPISPGSLTPESYIQVSIGN